MKKLNIEGLPVIKNKIKDKDNNNNMGNNNDNNNKLLLKKDFENSNTNDKLFDREYKQNETERLSQKYENDLIDYNNIMKFKSLKDTKNKNIKYSAKNQNRQIIKNKDDLNVSYSSDTLGSDFIKLNENEDKKLQKNLKESKNKSSTMQDIYDKKPNELDGNFIKIR
jgi:hypothetical protein